MSRTFARRGHSARASDGALARRQWHPSIYGAALLLGLLTSSGCVGARNNTDILEARLRQQEDLAYQYHRQLSELRGELEVAHHEADILRGQLSNIGQETLPAEYTQSLFRVEGLRFNSMFTRSRDQDGKPGDDVLTAVFYPVDEHGDMVKLPGAIRIEVLDMTRPEPERGVAAWEFSPRDSRELWTSGFLSSGYELKLPWSEPPPPGELIVHARLTTPDGRQFDATHTIEIEGDSLRDQPLQLAPPAEARPVSLNGNDSGRLRRSAASPQVKEILPMSFSREERPREEPDVRSETDGAGPTTGADEEADKQHSGDQPPPFPEGLQTSDNWTDETIPYLR
ncbi:MAG: hypothetical protein DWQ34_17675 [Planctomycetota bacterium]|nr:MAG: hypothetical protein DWQ34_17675 [Planctomycetota bacterium]REK25871.1 MAG: hypothetical protein DWQ41_11165 [Planctomycetota bacterium]REK37150.1 MAG: hypothetical protein DWQ45_07975 [Planctomycetota bacterium]